MIFISHRGNIEGPSDIENYPDQIIKILESGLDCEIDVWHHHSKWFLGHDRPDFEIEEEFLFQKGLWLHSKNLEALKYFTESNFDNYFWHQTDRFTLTSSNYIWTYPGQALTKNSIAVLPEKSTYSEDKLKNCYAICTDYITRYQKLLTI